jgi:hypothetical protein
MAYNPQGTEFHAAADRMRVLFESAYKDANEASQVCDACLRRVGSQPELTLLGF